MRAAAGIAYCLPKVSSAFFMLPFESDMNLVFASALLVTVCAVTPLTLLAQTTAVREGFMPVPGARIFYTDAGGPGVPVVLLHAATGNTSAWQYQTDAFVAAGYRPIAYDRRGWGRTVVEANGPVHMLLDFAETTAMAVPASKLSQRGQLPPLCPGHKRVMVMPRRELQEFGWSFREYQRLAGHTAPIVVESLREGLQVLSLQNRKGFEPVSDVASLGG